MLTVTDQAGNSATFTTPPVNIDKTPPTTAVHINGLGITNTAYQGSVQVSLSATDTTSGVAVITYTLDGGASQP